MTPADHQPNVGQLALIEADGVSVARSASPLGEAALSLIDRIHGAQYPSELRASGIFRAAIDEGLSAAEVDAVETARQERLGALTDVPHPDEAPFGYDERVPAEPAWSPSSHALPDDMTPRDLDWAERQLPVGDRD
jgi:hypothetical protein